MYVSHAIPAATHTTDTTIRSSVGLDQISHAVALMLTGLFAGFFGTYSFSVVRGFAQLDDITYVESFQAINATIRNLEFAVVFFGALPAIVLALIANRSGARSKQLFRGAALVFVVATVVITFVGNVPLNRDLAEVTSVTPTSAASAREAFESTWNQLNLARTATSALAFAALVTANTRPAATH